MSMASEELAERLRALLPPVHLREQKMFGTIAFMLNGNMLAAPMKDGALLLRVGKHGMAAALERPGASRMEMGTRSMGGFVVVSGDALEDDEALAEWLDIARAVVATLPPK